MSEKAEEALARTLMKTIQGTYVEVEDGTGTLTLTGTGEGWQTGTMSGAHIIFNIQSFDLSGYTLAQKTLFIQAALMQDMDLGPEGGSGPYAERLTIVSATPLNEANIYNDGGLGNWAMPGTPESTHSIQDVIAARGQFYKSQTNPNPEGLILTKEWNYGAGYSTAAEKLWVADCYRISGTAALVTRLPSIGFVLPSLIMEEPELEYMMRLSRSLQPVY